MKREDHGEMGKCEERAAAATVQFKLSDQVCQNGRYRQDVMPK